MALPELLNKAKTFGQEKLFNFYEELTDEQKKILLTDVQNIDFNLMQDLFKNLTNTKEETAEAEIAPIPCTDATSMCEEERKRLYDKGLQVLGEGKMAALTIDRKSVV
mgnify:FL=1